jgi:hypothetical protein
MTFWNFLDDCYLITNPDPIDIKPIPLFHDELLELDEDELLELDEDELLLELTEDWLELLSELNAISYSSSQSGISI